MKLVEQHIIKKNNIYYKELDKLCFLSKNLYNIALYEIRQQYFKDKTFLNYYSVNRLLHDRHDENYFALPSNTSQETLKLVSNNYKSFFKSLSSKKVDKVKIPGYLDKESGRQVVIYNKMTLSKNYLDKGIIKLPKSNIEFKSNKCNKICQVRIIPSNNHIVLEVIYEENEAILKNDNGKYLSIDLGINNLATCTSNAINSFIINGRPVKSINQYYNKTKAYLQSKLKNKYTSNKIYKLTFKRNNKIKDYFHKTSSYIVNQAVSNDLNTIVIGKNVGWKQDINIGKKNNQTFTQIPFDLLIKLISYKAKLKGINVILQEESYTSKVSFFDNDYIPTYGTDDDKLNASGKRIKRGLYKTKTSAFINADVNGSLNILRKYLKVSSDQIINVGSRGFVTNPLVVNI